VNNKNNPVGQPPRAPEPLTQNIYTSEDLKWDAPFGRISNQHWNPTLAEIKCPILFLQGFTTKVNGNTYTFTK